MRFLTLSSLCLGLSACSLLQVEQTRYLTTSSSGGIQQFYRERQQAKFVDAKQELGYANTTELAPEDAQAIYQRIALKRLEDQLQFRAEKEQYYSLKPYFKNDAERIEFLSLPNKMARQNLATNRSIASAEKSFEPSVSALIEKNDISKGMPMEAVKQSWGEPDVKEYAGEAMYGHQAWHYRKIVSTGNGYKEERRVVYFDSGRVSGWQTYQ